MKEITAELIHNWLYETHEIFSHVEVKNNLVTITYVENGFIRSEKGENWLNGFCEALHMQGYATSLSKSL